MALRAWLPVALLLIGAARHYLWPWFAVAAQGMASKGLGSAAALSLMAIVWWLVPRVQRTALLAWIMAWYAFEELQVVVCSAAYMVKPWPATPGVGICSSRIDFDIGAIGIMCVAWLALKCIPVSFDSSANHDRAQK